jgi:hypothetical protein
MNTTYVNVLAFIGGIELAAMHSESLPSDASWFATPIDGSIPAPA